MKVIKIFNNNIIAVVTDEKQIALVTGKGIGYNATLNESFKLREPMRLFKLSDPGKDDVYQMIERIDPDALEIAREIIIEATRVVDYPLFDSLLVQLADHVSFKIEMLSQDIIVPNLLMTEIRAFYPKEFSVGQFGVALINKRYGVTLDDDEASYLALHILNSAMRGMGTDVYKITEFIKEMVTVIQNQFDLKMEHNQWIYERLIVHLKYLGQRLLEPSDDDREPELEEGFLRIQESDLLNVNEVVHKADKLSQRIFGKKLSDNEKIYLSIHVLRIKHIKGEEHEKGME